MHIKYPKIRRIGTEETEGILAGVCIVQEKIDGANASVRLEDGQLCIGSRTQILRDATGIKNPFGWLVDYVLNHEGIKTYLEKNPTHRLFWEWLSQHTVRYSPEHYSKFWLYDILIAGDEESPMFIDPVDVNKIAFDYKIETPTIYAVMDRPTIDQLREYMNKPNLWDKQEGIVIKNTSFINKFGRPQYAKMVNESFKEENKIIFGNSSKHDELEERWALKYTTPWRFIKLVHKIEQDKQEKFWTKHISEMMGRIQYDIITEEIASIVKNETINFWLLRRCITTIARTMCLQYIEQWDKAPIFTFNHNE